MSRLTIPCAKDCICLPICMNKKSHDLFDCCKLLAAHWYRYVTNNGVHRKLSMKRSNNFVHQMNKCLKQTFMPFIYHEETHNWNTGKVEYKDVMIFTDAHDVQHMVAKHVYYTLQEYSKIGINLELDLYVGNIIRKALTKIHHRSFE